MEAEKPAVVRAAAGQALTRREFGVVALGASLSRRSLGEGGWWQSSQAIIGVQSYSFRDRPLDGVIAGLAAAGLGSCELWQDHLERDATSSVSGDAAKREAGLL